MIGQHKIKGWVDRNIDSFPHFLVLVGSKGSGKKTLAREIAHKLDCVYAECDSKVDTVRDVIDTAYTTDIKVLYCFADADTMKVQAKNAMLKITEEPPENAYFCLTVESKSSLLDTIQSRAYVFNMEPYSGNELKEYFSAKPATSITVDNVFHICNTPYEVDMLCEYGKEFIEYVELVIDNIAYVEPANAFKSAKKLALKNDEGYDLKLFWQCFLSVCINRWDTTDLTSSKHYASGVLVTQKALDKLSKVGVNKQQLYDWWTFNIREVWL